MNIKLLLTILNSLTKEETWKYIGILIIIILLFFLILTTSLIYIFFPMASKLDDTEKIFTEIIEEVNILDEELNYRIEEMLEEAREKYEYVRFEKLGREIYPVSTDAKELITILSVMNENYLEKKHIKDVEQVYEAFYKIETEISTLTHSPGCEVSTSSSGSVSYSCPGHTIFILTLTSYTFEDILKNLDFSEEHRTWAISMLSSNWLEAYPEIFATGLYGELGDGIFGWMVPGYYTVSSGFVDRVSPITGNAEKHKGIDIPVPINNDIVAVEDGVVTSSRKSTSYGEVVEISHGNGLSTLYAHNSIRLVKNGAEVKRGEVIAKSGNTGWSTGPHCHFEVKVNGIAVDPIPYFSVSEEEE